MPISKRFTTATVLGGLAAMSLATFGSHAQAYDGRGERHGWQHHAPTYQHAAPSARHYSHRNDHGDNRRDKAVARGVAIGLGAVILGGILAAEANRRNQPDYD